MQTQSWFVPLDRTDDDAHNLLCYENTVVFIVSSYQYLVTCIAFSISKPFRKPLYTNYWFTLSIILLLGFQLLFTFELDFWGLNDFLGVSLLYFKHLFRFTMVWTQTTPCLAK